MECAFAGCRIPDPKVVTVGKMKQPVRTSKLSDDDL